MSTTETPPRTWSVRDAGRLARVIKGICGITEETAEQLVGQLRLAADGKITFQTHTCLHTKPRLSRTTTDWTVLTEVRRIEG